MQCYFAIFEGNDIYNNDLCIRMELNSDWGEEEERSSGCKHKGMVTL